MSKAVLAPSILDSDFSELKETIAMLDRNDAGFVHLDIMDGQFVPPITFGPKIIRSIRPLTKLPFDAHLMIKNPENQIDDFIAAGSDYITFHEEATEKSSEIIEKIKQAGVKAGMSVKPNTPVETLDKYLDKLDMVLIMSVEPGYGGQKFMEDMLDKVRYLKEKISANSYNCIIQIDGGINKNTAKRAVDAGTDVLVAGSAIFGQADPEKALIELKEIIS